MVTLARIQQIPAYVGELRSQTGFYLGYIPNTYADQATEDNYYETVRKDVEIARCLHLLGLMGAGEKLDIVCEDEKLKNIAKFAVQHIQDFLHARKSLVEKAVLFGLGLQRKYYETRRIDGVPVRVVTRLQEVDRRRLRIERDQDDRNNLYWTLWSPLVDQYIELESRKENPDAGDGTAVEDYIWYIHAHEELSPYFEGFGDTLYALAYIKSKVLPYWADLCESWAKPFLVASVDSAVSALTAALGDGFVSATKRVNDLLETFEKARARHAVVIDKNDKVEWHERGSAGANILREMLQYCDSKIQLLILGAELSTTAAGVGSYALGSVHKQATDTIVLYNRLRLAEVLETDLIQDFFIRNQAELRRLGVGVPEVGEIRVKVKVEFEELEKQQKIKELQGQGMQGQFPSQQQKSTRHL